MLDFIRKDDETDAQLINRVCSSKDDIGTWVQVADVLNSLLGKDYSESKYRKWWNSYSAGFNDGQSVKCGDCKNNMEDKIAELRKERIKLQTLNIEKNRIDRIEARKELYYEQIANVITTLPLPDFHPADDCTVGKDTKVEYLLTLSDIHAGSCFKTEYNEYSIEIMMERFLELTERVIEFIKTHKCKEFYVVGLGDFIQGCIHMNDLKINESSVVKATVQVSHAVASFLNSISAFTHVNYYHIISSNHSQMRYLGTKANEIMGEDMEYVIGHYIKDMLSLNKNVNVVVPEEASEYIQVPIPDYNVVCMHGHQIKNLDTALNTISAKMCTNVDYLIIGHQHNHKVLTGTDGCTYDTEVLVCPSFVGADPFADRIMKGCKAAVMIYGFHEYEGHNETYKFILN